MNTGSFGQKLRRERKRLHWSQERLAEEIGVSVMSINRWEHDKTLPHPHYRQQLYHILRITDDTLFETPEIPESPVHSGSLICNIPFRRNPLFTGHESLLLRLHEVLYSRQSGMLNQIHALSGLGGIGKTQAAIEYAYRFRNHYSALLWVRAETRETLIQDVCSIALLLKLSEKDEQEQPHILGAVRQWLTQHDGWLLVLDNVENFTLVEEFLPQQGNGHVLLTTRAQATGTLVHRLDLEPLEDYEGALLLLRRAKLLQAEKPLEMAPEAFQKSAKDISYALGGLPLALDQAGAYIEETRCYLTDYLHRLRTHQKSLLSRRGHLCTDHPEPTYTTMSLCIEKVVQENPLAYELLRLCAFLSPDAIPEEIIARGGSEDGPLLRLAACDPFILDDALAVLGKYSLLHRHSERKTLALHRIVQTVLKAQMEKETQRQWSERVVRIVNRIVSNGEDVSTWPDFQQYLPHAEVCAHLIEQEHMVFAEAGDLLNKLGTYLREHGHLLQAEKYLWMAHDICHALFGPLHTTVAQSIEDIAWLYRYQEKYEEAGTLFHQALDVFERQGEAQRFNIANCLNNLAVLYYDQRRFAEAEAFYQQSLMLRKQANPQHPDVGESLHNLATLYTSQKRFAEAEPLFQQALALRKQLLGSQHLYVAHSLNNMAILYWKQQKYVQAEDLLHQALPMYERHLGRKHRSTMQVLANLASCYFVQGRYGEAELLMQQVHTFREHYFGPRHLFVAESSYDLGLLYHAQGKLSDAKLLLHQSLAIREQQLGAEHPLTQKAQASYALSLELPEQDTEFLPMRD